MELGNRAELAPGRGGVSVLGRAAGEQAERQDTDQQQVEKCPTVVSGSHGAAMDCEVAERVSAADRRCGRPQPRHSNDSLYFDPPPSFIFWKISSRLKLAAFCRCG